MHQFKDPYVIKNNNLLLKDAKYQFNSNRYEFYELENKIIFDKYNGESKLISKGYSEFLYKLYHEKIALNGYNLIDLIPNESTLNLLLENEFLIDNKSI